MGEFNIRDGLRVNGLSGNESELTSLDASGKLQASGKTAADLDQSADIAAISGADYVNTLNGLTGDVTIVDGGNIDITVVGNTIEISGGAGGGGSTTTLIGGDGITVTEAPTDTWTISVSGDYATNSLVQNISGNLQSQIDSITGSSLLQGSIECNTVDKTYLISHDSVDSNSVFPMISLTVPSSGSLLYVQGIHDISDDSFKVTLSDTPAVSGYEINWLLGTSDILTTTGSSLQDEIGTGTRPITSNESIIPAISGTYDLGSVSKPWKELHLVGSTIYMGGKAISVENNRLKFNKVKTLAYTDDVSGSYVILENKIYNVESKANSISAASNYEYTVINQDSHGFELLDPVKMIDTNDTEPFSVEKIYAVTNDATYPDYSYDTSNKEYTIKCKGRGWGLTQDDINYYAVVASKQNVFGDLSIRTKSHSGYGQMGLVVLDPTNNKTLTVIGVKIVNHFSPKYDKVYKNKIVNGSGQYPELDDQDLSGIGNDNIDLKIITYDAGGTVGIKCYYKTSSSSEWSKLGSNEDTGIDTNNYYVGIYCQGSAYSPETTLTSKVYDIAGNLSQVGSDIVWDLAGGSNDIDDFADGIIIDVLNSNKAMAATSGIIEVDGSFTGGKVAYLDQNVKGSETYNRPGTNPQRLWTGISNNKAKLNLDKQTSAIKFEFSSETGIPSLLPTSISSKLGTTEERWDTLHVNTIELSGQDLNDRLITIETEVDAISGVDYSTNETYVGHKWIDGSNVYRKVVSLSNKPNAGSENNAHNISNIDIVVDARLIFNISDARMVLSSSNVNNSIDDEHFFVNGTNIVWHSPFDRTSATDTYCIIEYTKT